MELVETHGLFWSIVIILGVALVVLSVCVTAYLFYVDRNMPSEYQRVSAINKHIAESESIRTKLDELQSKEILGYCFSNGEYSVILSRHLRGSKPKWAWYISNKNDLESFLTYLNN